MPRTVTEVNLNHFAKLKDLVLENTDIELVRSVDCDRLAKNISEQTSTHINGITFKRIFGFTKYPFNPSVQTLDILSQFVGYRNWVDFELSLSEYQPISGKELDILLSFYDFDLINDIKSQDGGIQSMSRKIALRFREDVPTFKRAIPLLAKKRYAQIFFMEHFPDYDNLCNYYYLVYEEYLKSNKGVPAQLFSHEILFLKSFWTLDFRGCRKHLSEIRKFEINRDLHPYLIGRYYACNIVFEFYFGEKKKVNQYYDEYLRLRKRLIKQESHFQDFPASEYKISEGLLHAKSYNKCIEVIELALRDYSFKMEFVRKGYYRQMQLFWAIAKKKLNPDFKIDQILNKIDPNNFYFISQKHYSVILYYAHYLESENTDYLQQARALASEMGNKYLSGDYFDEC